MQTIFFFKTVVQTIFFLIFLPADNFFYQIRYPPPPVRKIMVRPLCPFDQVRVEKKDINLCSFVQLRVQQKDINLCPHAQLTVQ